MASKWRGPWRSIQNRIEIIEKTRGRIDEVEKICMIQSRRVTKVINFMLQFFFWRKNVTKVI